ncbi:hypothetical protein [Amycolatopsis australiensis]|uniref:Uncharacterized protein n=1 Tax=Amycolatopsis australiensis TaxID=546364 RepID=A0A1K1LLR7_9PSEU|nr:hypothetical protein [Amycolatopsis australiensis]SFW11818.1 hypothetical protein SAMN04489730_0061 [Amycolatopsis australiensis]
MPTTTSSTTAATSRKETLRDVHGRPITQPAEPAILGRRRPR